MPAQDAESEGRFVFEMSETDAESEGEYEDEDGDEERNGVMLIVGCWDGRS